MNSKDEKSRRRAIVQKQRADEAVRQVARMPISLSHLGRLFDRLDALLAVRPCDHSLRHVRSILAAQGVSPEAVIPWLEKFGGYCDCEVSLNVEHTWGPRVRGG